MNIERKIERRKQNEENERRREKRNGGEEQCRPSDGRQSGERSEPIRCRYEEKKASVEERV